MMNTNKYGLQYAGPRRARRGALRQWLLDLVIGAAAMALLWWLFSLVSRAATKGDVMPGMRAAGFSDAMAYVIVAVLVIAVLWRLRVAAMMERAEERAAVGEDPTLSPAPTPTPARSEGGGVRDGGGGGQAMPHGMTRRAPRCVKGCQWECWCLDSELEWVEVVYYPRDPLAEGDTLKREQRAHEAMPEGMTRHDAAEIARAAAAEIELCRRMVDGAMHALSVEDYGDALAGASRRLGQVRVTMRELAMTFDQGGIKA